MLWKLEERNRKHVFSIFFLFYILAAIFSSYLILNDIFSFLFSLFVGIFFCSSEKDFQKNKSLLFYHYVKACMHTMYSIHRKESYHLGVKFLENIIYAANMTDGRALEKKYLSKSIFLCELKKSYYGSFLAN